MSLHSISDAESGEVNANRVSKDDTLDMTDTIDSELNGFAANGTIKANAPVPKEKAEVQNGNRNPLNSNYDLREPPPKNNGIPKNKAPNQKLHIKDFPQLYVECDTVSILQLKSDIQILTFF